MESSTNEIGPSPGFVGALEGFGSIEPGPEGPITLTVSVSRGDNTAPTRLSFVILRGSGADSTWLPIPPQGQGRSRKEEVWWEDTHPEEKRLNTLDAYICPLCTNTPLMRHEYLVRASPQCAPSHAICTDCLLDGLVWKVHRVPKTREDQRLKLRCPSCDTAYDLHKLYGERIPDNIKELCKNKLDGERVDRVKKRDVERTKAEAQRATMLKCGTCLRVFKNHSAKRRHVRREHLGITDKCEDCQKVFSTKQRLQTHRSQGCKALARLHKRELKNEDKRGAYNCRVPCFYNVRPGQSYDKMGFASKEERDAHESEGNCVCPKFLKVHVDVLNLG